MEITLSPSVAEAISRGAVVEQLRGRGAFRDDDDASSVCTPAPDDGPRLSAEAAAATDGESVIWALSMCPNDASRPHCCCCLYDARVAATA